MNGTSAHPLPSLAGLIPPSNDLDENGGFSDFGDSSDFASAIKFDGPCRTKVRDNGNVVRVGKIEGCDTVESMSANGESSVVVMTDEYGAFWLAPSHVSEDVDWQERVQQGATGAKKMVPIYESSYYGHLATVSDLDSRNERLDSGNWRTIQHMDMSKSEEERMLQEVVFDPDFKGAIRAAALSKGIYRRQDAVEAPPEPDDYS